MGYGLICTYCKWGNDRAMLAQKYGVANSSGGCTNCMLLLCCTSCALAQELNHIKANMNKPMGPQIIVAQPQPQMVMAYPQQQQVVMMQQPQMMVQQPQMMVQPQGYPPRY